MKLFIPFTVLLLLSCNSLNAQWGFTTSIGRAIPAGDLRTINPNFEDGKWVKSGIHIDMAMQYQYNGWLGLALHATQNRHSIHHNNFESFLENKILESDFEVEKTSFKTYYLLLGPSFGIDSESYGFFFQPGIGLGAVTDIEFDYYSTDPFLPISGNLSSHASIDLAWGATASFIAYFNESFGVSVEARYLDSKMYRKYSAEASAPGIAPVVESGYAYFRPITIIGSLGLRIRF